MSTLVLLRHGESVWNRANLFTGWADVGLTERGEDEAREGGRLLAEAALRVDVVHTSLQKRAIATAVLALAEMDLEWLPVRRHWRLNERHYGDLEGKNKRQVAEQYGPEQLFTWRRGYDTPPPPVAPDDPRHPRHDPRYAELAPDVLPSSECLKDVVARMLPYWHDAIVPDLRAGRTPLVVAHGNSLRGLVKHLDGISDADIAELNIPTGLPLVYELDDDLKPVSSRYLGDAEEVRRRADKVARQAEEPPTGIPA